MLQKYTKEWNYTRAFTQSRPVPTYRVDPHSHKQSKWINSVSTILNNIVLKVGV